jgi:hypothetical protein
MRSVDLIMNKNERSTTTLLSAIVISSLLASAFLLVGSMNFSQKAMGQAEEVFSENATSTEEAGAIDNQTAPAATNATTTNQTAPTTPAPTTPAPTPTNATAAGANQTAPATNLTSSDIEPVRDSLNAAREGLQANDTQAVIESINDADGALFAIIIEEGTGPVSDQLTTLSDDIDTTRESVRNQDNARALEDLNAADSQLLVITGMLPAEEADEEEADEEEADEEEPEEE